MFEPNPHENSLVLYKTRPARVQRVDDKLTLELEGNESIRVRPKDVVLLHPGPMHSLAELRPQSGEVQTAWEILAGNTTTLQELAELAFGSYTPASAWAAWELVADGLYFRGTAQQIVACTPEEVKETQAERAAEAAEKRAWETFLAHARVGQLTPPDEEYLRDVENLALGRTDRSRVLRALGREESPENAHATLLELGYWDYMANPYPQRLGIPLTPPAPASVMTWPDSAQDLPDEPRVDLTALPAYAIDDELTETPDDALSYVRGLQGAGASGRLWVHVADPAVLICPEDAVDREARGRGATLHLPERIVPMLPEHATPLFGLGLAELSPALSFGLDLDSDGKVERLEIAPSWVRVSRLTYEEADARLAQEPFSSLYRLAQAYAARRQAKGAIEIELPEVAIRVRQDQVVIRSVLPLRSRVLVENAMIMAGEAIARFATEHGIPLPYATQEGPETGEPAGAQGLASMFALRRTLKRSQYRSNPAPHSGLGLAAYVQATSPMRRYLDLVVHQQLRAYLWLTSQVSSSLSWPTGHGNPASDQRQLLTAGEILERVGAVEAVIGSVRQAEQFSNRHWTLAHLMQHPNWHGPAVLVEKRNLTGTFIIPELALEVPVHLPSDLPLDSEVVLKLRSVDLPRLDARFRIEGSKTGG